MTIYIIIEYFLELPLETKEKGNWSLELRRLVKLKVKKVSDKQTTEKNNEEQAKIGVFVCHWGINIAGILDIPRIVEEIDKLELRKQTILKQHGIDYEYTPTSQPNEGS